MTQRLRFLLAAAPCLFAAAACAQQPDPGITVRPGYTLSIANADLTNPRHMELGPDGILYVSQPDASNIVALRDEDEDGIYEKVTPFVAEHETVHGLEWHDGWLYFTESEAIFRARDTNKDGVADETVNLLDNKTLPPGGGHWWRSILIHNGRLYTSIGDSSNASDQTDTKRQKIWSYDLNGKDEKLYATGIRNTEELEVRPGTGEIWGMDHNSDWFGEKMERKGQEGDEIPQPITSHNPPEEFNKYVEGGFYGHPFIVGTKLPRYEYMDRPDIVELAEKTIIPEWNCGSHWAANGLCFYTADQFPTSKGNAFIAYHGSWNRRPKGGYKVTSILFEDGKPYGELPFVQFLDKDGEKVHGRPVDVIQTPEGDLLISDDGGNKIYRLRYSGK